jgi:hypothetical protein
MERPPDYTSVSVVDPRVQTRARSSLGDRFDLVVEAVRDGTDPFRFSSSESEHGVISDLKGNLSDDKWPIPDGARSILQKKYEDDLAVLARLVDFDVSDWMA